MKKNILILRHGKTKANLRKEYTGRIDYSLCDEGIFELKKIHNLLVSQFAQPQVIFSSPMKRCIETSKIYYPNHKPILINNLREINFGIFEGKTYDELIHLKEFQNFIESSWQSKIPNGEQPADFSERCFKGFNEVIEYMIKIDLDYTVIICHGGVIMSLLYQISTDGKDFYDYYVENGKGYFIEYDTDSKKAEIIEKI